MSNPAEIPQPEPAPSIHWHAFILLFAFFSAVFFLRYAAPVFIPVVLAVLVSYSLDPVVTWFARWRIPRPLGALLVVLGVLAGLGTTAYGLRSNFIAVIESVPETARRLRTTLQQRLDEGDGSSALDRIKQAATEIEKTAEATASISPAKAGVTRVQVEPQRFRVSDYFLLGSRGLAELAAQATVVLFLVYFLLASGDLYKRKLVRIVGDDFSKKRITVEALHEIDSRIERFLAVQIWTSVLVGVATWLGLAFIGVTHPAIWGAAAGVLNFIPYFGAVIAAAGLGIVAFVQFGTITSGVEAGGLALLIRIIEGGLLSPILMGRAAGINGVALFVSLLFWGWLWGLIGTLVAVPIMMIVKTACERIDGLQVVGELLSQK
jgi:predicted PurR-regulated permease PerM